MEPSRQEGMIWLGVIGLFLLALLTRSGLLLVLATLLFLVVGVVSLWGRYALERVEYRRRFERTRCFAGEEMELTVELTNRKILPLSYLTVDDSVPEDLQVRSHKVLYHRKGRSTLRLLFSMAWYQKVIRHYKVLASRRGFYRLGPATVKAGDPFGWVDRTMEVAESEMLFVYPRILPLEQVGLPSRRPFGDLKSNDRLFEDPLRFAGVREYQQGDPLNRIHWKASAAAGRLQVRQLDPSANLGLAVFLNTWGFDRFWEGNEASALEAGCTLAASVINWATDEGLAVGLYANGLVYEWGLSLRLPPARGPQVLAQTLEGLARLQTGSTQPIWELMAAETPTLPYGTSVVVITRQVGDDLAAAILRIQRSGRPVTLIVTATEPQEIPRLPGVRIYEVGGEEGLHAAVLAQ
ncbi:MAG: DUF58 domain-containing protein [Bacillota bacterium]